MRSLPCGSNSSSRIGPNRRLCLRQRRRPPPPQLLCGMGAVFLLMACCWLWGAEAASTSSSSLPSSTTSKLATTTKKTTKKKKKKKRTTKQKTTLVQETIPAPDDNNNDDSTDTLDLSYLHNLPAEKLAGAIQTYWSWIVDESLDLVEPPTTALAPNSTTSHENSTTTRVALHLAPPMTVDASHSALGTVGFQTIVEALFPNLPPPAPQQPQPNGTTHAPLSQPEENSTLEEAQKDAANETVTNTTTLPSTAKEETNATNVLLDTCVSSSPTTRRILLQPMNVLCRMNDLTPGSIKMLLQRYVQCHAAAADAAAAASCPHPNPLLVYYYLSSLDVGWNLLATDEFSAQDPTHNFHSSLEYVLALNPVAPYTTTTTETTTMEPISHQPTTNQEQPPPPFAPFLTRLAMEHCGLGPETCRAVAKGLLARHGVHVQDDDDDDNDKGANQRRSTRPKRTKKPSNLSSLSSSSSLPPPPPLSLHLAGNRWIGDSGTAALAAALRRLALLQLQPSNDDDESPSKRDVDNNDKKKTDVPPVILDTLDLSDCGITDVGAQALALALEEEGGGGLIRHLILSHNQITHEGATALGRALILSSSASSTSSSCRLPHCLDLSNNPIGDQGGIALAALYQQGSLPRLILRSCHIMATGATAFGKALSTLVASSSSSSSLSSLSPQLYQLDLSGNPLGRLRGKLKSSSSSGGKYSASRLKSTATATAQSYMNRLKEGFKQFQDGASTSSSGDSDDEEEDDDEAALDGDSNQYGGDKSSKEPKRCGIRALVNAFLDQNAKTANDNGPDNKGGPGESPKFQLGFRHCFLDHGAADALAALIVEARQEYTSDIALNVALNPILEDDMVTALEEKTPSSGDDEVRLEMAERYMDQWHTIQESKQRAAEARARARAQIRHADESRDRWGQYDNDDDEEEEEEEEEKDNCSDVDENDQDDNDSFRNFGRRCRKRDRQVGWGFDSDDEEEEEEEERS